MGRWAIIVATLIGTGAFFIAMFLTKQPHRGTASRGDTGLVAEPESFEVLSDGAAKPKRVTTRLRNASLEPIRIVSLTSTCGCTVADRVPTKAVRPGETIELPVVVSPPGLGTKHIALTITTDSKITPTIQLHITAHGETVQAPYITRVPPQIRLAVRQPNEIVEQEFTVEAIENRDEKPWISAIDLQSDSLRCELIGPPEDEAFADDLLRRTYRFRIHGLSPGRNMTAAAMNIITTTPSTQSMKQIWVNFAIEPLVRAVPSLVKVRADANCPIIQRDILLVAEDDLNSACKLVDDSLPIGISVVNVSQVGDLRVLRFRVSIDSQVFDTLDEQTDHRVILHFYTGIKAQPTVDVPLVLVR